MWRLLNGSKHHVSLEETGPDPETPAPAVGYDGSRRGEGLSLKMNTTGLGQASRRSPGRRPETGCKSTQSLDKAPNLATAL